MENELTASYVRQQITLAHFTLNRFCRDFKISRTAFWRWEKLNAPIHPVTRQRIIDGLETVRKLKQGV